MPLTATRQTFAGLSGLQQTPTGLSVPAGPLDAYYLATGPRVIPGLVAWWRMDELSWNGTSGEVRDASGNGLSGKATAVAAAFPSTISAGALARCGSFDGAHQFVQLGTPAPLVFERTQAFTFLAWLNVTAYGANNSTILANALGSGSFAGYFFHIDASGHLLLTLISTSGGSNYLQVKTAGVVAKNTWVHATATYAGTSLAAGAATYLNGVLDTSIVHDALTVSILGGGNVNLASYANGANPGTFIGGGLDDVRVYNRVLQSSEIAAIANHGIGYQS